MTPPDLSHHIDIRGAIRRDARCERLRVRDRGQAARPRPYTQLRTSDGVPTATVKSSYGAAFIRSAEQLPAVRGADATADAASGKESGGDSKGTPDQPRHSTRQCTRQRPRSRDCDATAESTRARHRWNAGEDGGTHD